MTRLFVLAAALCCMSLPVHAAQKLDPNDITEAHYIKFSPILMSIVQERRVRGLLQIEITLKLTDPNERQELVEQRARMSDRLIQAVAGMTRGAIRVDAPINVAMVQAVLQRQIDAVIGEKRAQVLVVDYSTRTQ